MIVCVPSHFRQFDAWPTRAPQNDSSDEIQECPVPVILGRLDRKCLFLTIPLMVV